MNTAATRSPWHTARQRFAWLLPVAVLLLLALAVRIAGARWYAHSSNPDYGIVVLMARNIARGVDFPVFFYGQPYMGSFEPMLSAVLARLFGDSPFVICLGTALLSFVMVVALAHLARRVAGPWAALAAVALCIVGTPGFFHYNVSPRGGYALALLLTVLLLHAGIFMETRAETAAERRALAWRRAVFGLLGGLGFWNFWLTLPALAAAGLLLLIRLRWRVFHWRVWLPALAGFMLGSLPWWIWNARHDWASLTSTSASSGLRASLAALVKLPLERVPKLIGAVDFLPAGHYGRIVIHLLVLFLAVLPLVVLVLEWRKSEAAPMRRLAAGFLLYAALFTMAYGFSSFGAIPSSRYLLPLVPIYAVWVGCGITRCFAVARSGDAARRSSAMSLAVPGVPALALLVALSVWTLKAHAARAARQHRWIESARLLAEHPGAREALFAKFDLFGINWATDEKVCAVSPEIWRYTPYLERLEAASSPGVLENMGGFDHFLEQTGGTAVYERVGRYRLHYHAVPPPGKLAVIPAAAIASISDGCGREWRHELTDDSGETCVRLGLDEPGEECCLRVRFREPVEVAGVRLVPRGANSLFYWSVGGVLPDDTRRQFSGPLVHSGYYWSGPRFFHGGLAARAEQRFAPVVVSELAIRLKLAEREKWKGIETLQVLAADQTPPPEVDFAAAAEVVKAAGVTRLFADRWAANQLASELRGAAWVSREPSLTGEDPCWCAAVPVAAGSGVIVAPVDAPHIRGVLERAGIAADERPAGGLVLFQLCDLPVREDDTPVLAFYAGQLFCTRPSETHRPDEPFEASYLDGKLILRGISEWHESDGAESGTQVEFDWSVTAEGVPSELALFIHGLDSRGRIAFMLNEPLRLDTSWGAPPWGCCCTTLHTVRPRVETADGGYTLAMGLFKPGLHPHRLVPDTREEHYARRLLLPHAMVLKRQAHHQAE